MEDQASTHKREQADLSTFNDYRNLLDEIAITANSLKTKPHLFTDKENDQEEVKEGAASGEPVDSETAEKIESIKMLVMEDDAVIHSALKQANGVTEVAVNILLDDRKKLDQIKKEEAMKMELLKKEEAMKLEQVKMLELKREMVEQELRLRE